MKARAPPGWQRTAAHGWHGSQKEASVLRHRAVIHALPPQPQWDSSSREGLGTKGLLRGLQTVCPLPFEFDIKLSF